MSAPLILFVIAAYFIGSIPFGLLLTKGVLRRDIREIGSGNIGATNVLRTGNKSLALLTLILDGAKGAFAVFLWVALLHLFAPAGEDSRIHTTEVLCIGLFAILGHCFPIWLKFKGGKGVSTAIGVLLSAVPIVGLVACAVWLAVFLATRISSASALMATIFAPFMTLIAYGNGPALIVFLIALLILWRHKDNIRRLLKGEEPKFGKKKEE
ncbi:MAG: glycerol-3-phosphate 1-O-acyltransferase PlsY [Alphaproteobacteria bacterium]|nr:glycerol-3-phosphate 1-O-acyltransferase PlsY [Alphaproteobacteria bacterium]